jgi:hypothetical protein
LDSGSFSFENNSGVVLDVVENRKALVVVDDEVVVDLNQIRLIGRSGGEDRTKRNWRYMCRKCRGRGCGKVVRMLVLFL